MNVVSTAVAVTAAGALVLGSVGMASARTSDAHSQRRWDRSARTPTTPQRTAGTLPKLVGIVNDNRDIEISDRTPSPGRYKIVVRDSTASHNWHLYGNGKSISTTVRGTGRWVFKIRLPAGNYRVVCDPRTTTTWSSTSSSDGRAHPRRGCAPRCDRPTSMSSCRSASECVDSVRFDRAPADVDVRVVVHLLGVDGERRDRRDRLREARVRRCCGAGSVPSLRPAGKIGRADGATSAGSRRRGSWALAPLREVPQPRVVRPEASGVRRPLPPWRSLRSWALVDARECRPRRPTAPGRCGASSARRVPSSAASVEAPGLEVVERLDVGRARCRCSRTALACCMASATSSATAA